MDISALTGRFESLRPVLLAVQLLTANTVTGTFLGEDAAIAGFTGLLFTLLFATILPLN